MSELPDNVDLQWIGRQLLAMRHDIRDLRGLRSDAPNFNAPSSGEFLSLFQAHRHLRDDYAKLRERVDTLQDIVAKETPRALARHEEELTQLVRTAVNAALEKALKS